MVVLILQLLCLKRLSSGASMAYASSEILTVLPPAKTPYHSHSPKIFAPQRLVLKFRFPKRPLGMIISLDVVQYPQRLVFVSSPPALPVRQKRWKAFQADK